MADSAPQERSHTNAPPPADGPIVGIDLGTTNSLVAVSHWGEDRSPRCLPDEQGRVMLPSVVRFNADGSATIGHEARAEAVLHPLTTISSIKRLMGRSMRDAGPDLPYLSYSIVEGANQTARIQLPAAGSSASRTVSPQEVSAMILRDLKGRASRTLGVDVRRAVVTVPAYFDDAQRQATRDAGRLAGLDVVRIVNEPTAAALAYGLGATAMDRGAVRTIVVYDLGGGTFDVSVLRLTPGESLSPNGSGDRAAVSDFFQVLATAGDTHLGGDDFDHVLVAMFTREIAAQLGGTIDLAPETRQALRQFAEQVRVRLSDQASASVRIDLGDAHTYERTVTRDELETLIGPLVERTIDRCGQALRDARRELGTDKIDAIVMVGGATRTPLVRRRVREAFSIEPYTAIDPDQVVALGAAVQGAMLSGVGTIGPGGGRSLLLDVVPLSLGIETVGGAMAKLIMRNSTVPARAHEMFSTSVEGQTSVKLNVLQGEREMAADCRSLGTFHLRGIPPMPAGIPKLRVEFFVDANGILTVTAIEQRSGKRLDVQIVPSHGLSQDEVERLERESFAHAREDMLRHRITDLVANSKLDLHWITRTLERVEGSQSVDGPRLEAEYAAGLRRQIGALQSFITAASSDWRSVDPDAFHAAKEDLDRASIRLHEVAIALSLRDATG